MKKKVLFALMALFSFVGAWANVAVTVGDYTVTLDKKWMVAGDAAPEVLQVNDATTGFTVVGVCDEDKDLVDVDDFDEDDVANLYLKVFYDNKYLFVPFKLVKVADTSLYDIVADEASWNASEENGGLRLYHSYFDSQNLYYDYGWWQNDYQDADPEDPSTNAKFTKMYPGQDPTEEWGLNFSRNWISAINCIDRSWPERTSDNNAQILKSESDDEDAADYANLTIVDQDVVLPSDTWKKHGYPWVVFYCGDNEENAHTFGFYYKNGDVEAYDDVSGYSISGGEGKNFMTVAGLFKDLGYPLTLPYNNHDGCAVTGWYDENDVPHNYDEFVEDDGDGPLTFSHITIYELPVGDDLEASVEAVTVNNWTRTPASATYIGEEIEPVVKVDGDYLYETPYTVQYTWNDPALGEIVAVDAPVHAGTYTMTLGIEGEDGNFVPVSNATRTFTVNKNTIEIVLQQIYMPYGSAISDLEPVYVLKKAAEDATPTDQIVVTDLGTVAKGTGWSVDDNDQPEPNSVKNYTTLGQPKAFVGRTYKQATEEVEVEPGVHYTQDEIDTAQEGDDAYGKTTDDWKVEPVYEEQLKYDENDDPVYTDEIVFAGYEDYIATTNTSSANIVAIKGILTVTVDAESFTKVYGDDDPDYNEMDATTNLPIYFTAKNQAGNDVTGITIYRPDYKKTLADSDEIDPATEAVGEHELAVDLGDEADHYDAVFVYEENEDEKTPVLTITPFDLEEDVDDPETDEVEAEKFIIAVNNVVYNAETQYPDAEITFNHAVLGTINLTYNVDAEGEKTPIVPFVKKWHEGGDASNTGVYETDYYAYNKGAASYPYPGGFVGSYSGNQKNVKRNATTAAIEKGAAIEVTGRGNFKNAKTQAYAIQPAPLAVKAKDNVDMAYAGPTPNFGVELATTTETQMVDEVEVEVEVPVQDFVTAEPAATRETILENLGKAIWKYAPNDEYGYDGYDGGITDKTADPVVPYAISVKEAAQTAVNVILAASNYAVTYTKGESTVVPVELGFIVRNQLFNYNTDGTNAAEYTYNKPAINTTVSLDPESPEGDYVPGTVELAVGTVLPEGVSINDLFSAIAFKDNKEITAASADAYEKVLTLTKTEAANNPGYDITITNGDWTVTPLTVMHLDYANVGQALQDHQGLKMNEVYMPARNLKNKNWYAMVLPFDINAEDFFDKAALGYGAFEVQDIENTSKDVRFKLTIEKIEANTPFILKVVHNFDADRNGAKPLCDVVFNEQFGEPGVTIATLPEGQAYNDLEKSPFTVDQSGNKFIGQYTGKTGLADTERYMSKGEFYKGYPDPAPEGKTPTYLAPTVAYLQFPSVAAAANARIFIEEPDGTTTAIDGVGVAEDDDAEIAAGSAAQGWYTITGVKLDAEPTTTGTYIFNGKKVFIQK